MKITEQEKEIVKTISKIANCTENKGLDILAFIKTALKFEKDAIITNKDIMEIVKCSESKACDIMKEARKLAKADGKEPEFMSARITKYYLYKYLGLQTIII